VLLDTAVFIFAVEAPHRLTERALAALRDPNNLRQLSTISLSEIAVKATLGKLDFSADMVQRAMDDMDIRVLPFTSDHAFHLFGLPVHHRDPFDRQIIAQALSEEIPVVTPDKQFGSYGGLKLIW
jgi:PIN domain nuclease of toxin-antitoxin system